MALGHATRRSRGPYERKRESGQLTKWSSDWLFTVNPKHLKTEKGTETPVARLQYYASRDFLQANPGIIMMTCQTEKAAQLHLQGVICFGSPTIGRNVLRILVKADITRVTNDLPRTLAYTWDRRKRPLVGGMAIQLPTPGAVYGYLTSKGYSFRNGSWATIDDWNRLLNIESDSSDASEEKVEECKDQKEVVLENKEKLIV